MNEGAPEEAPSVPGANVRLAVAELPEQNSINGVGVGEEGANGDARKSGGKAKRAETGHSLGGGATKKQGVIPIDPNEETNEGGEEPSLLGNSRGVRASNGSAPSDGAGNEGEVLMELKGDTELKQRKHREGRGRGAGGGGGGGGGGQRRERKK